MTYRFFGGIPTNETALSKPPAIWAQSSTISSGSEKDSGVPHAKPGLPGARRQSITKMPYSLNGVYRDKYQILSEDGDRLLCRGWRLGDDGTRESVLVILPAAEHPSPSSLDRLTHEYGLKAELDEAWAVRPLELVRDGGRAMLVLEDPGGEPLDLLLGAPNKRHRCDAKGQSLLSQ
jgi:hypothetical protein